MFILGGVQSEEFTSFTRMVGPIPVSQVLIEADAPREAVLQREIGQDDGKVPRQRHHGMVPVRLALPKAEGMHMDVRHNLQALGAANFPKQSELPAVEFNDALVE